MLFNKYDLSHNRFFFFSTSHSVIAPRPFETARGPVLPLWSQAPQAQRSALDVHASLQQSSRSPIFVGHRQRASRPSTCGRQCSYSSTAEASASLHHSRIGHKYSPLSPGYHARQEHALDRCRPSPRLIKLDEHASIANPLSEIAKAAVVFVVVTISRRLPDVPSKSTPRTVTPGRAIWMTSS